MIRVIAIFFCLLFMNITLAAEYATVTADRAIVYADIQMSAPIGYLVRGKRIRIGDVTRNKGALYPFVLNNKIVYIEKKNIATSQDIQLINTATERIKEQSRLKEDTVVGLGPVMRLQRLSLDNRYGDMKSDVLLLAGISLSGELNHYKTRESRILTFDYVTGTKGEQSFREASLSFGFGYQVLSFNYFILRPKASLVLIPYAQYQLGDLFQKNGYGGGAALDLDMEIKFGHKLGMIIGAGYHFSQYFGFDLPAPYPEEFNPTLSGYEIAARFQYHF